MRWRLFIEKLETTGLLSRLPMMVAFLIAILLLWFLMPFLGLNGFWPRVFVITTFCFIGIAVKIWRHSRSRLQNERIKKEINQQNHSTINLMPLRKNIATAIKKLRASELGKNYRFDSALYTLPWYLLLGSSQSGKSTLLRNSGLRYPLCSDEEIQLKGFTGTKDLDWWFADNAIVLDTAGRYTTEVDDKDEWLGLLHILKRHRWRLPLNGVMLTLNLEKILLANTQQREQYALIIRERIAELNQHLGYILPITIIITKCDLVKGFTEAFAASETDERQQAWGISLKNLSQEQNINDSVKEKLQILYQQFVNYSIQNLDYTADLTNTSVAYNYNKQFKIVLSYIEDFIFNVTHENPYQSKFNLRGIYFTSANQQGDLIESMIIDTKQCFTPIETNDDNSNLHPISKSYFIKHLLNDRIFADKNSAVMNQRTRLIFNTAKYTGMCLSAMMVIFMVLFFTWAYAYNNTQLTQSVNKAGALRTVIADKHTDQWDLLSAQLDVYQQFHRFDKHTQLIALHKRLGLYKGNTQQVSLQKILALSLQNNFLYPVAHHYEKQLQHYQRRWSRLTKQQQQKIYFSYYQTLRNYLQLGVYQPNVDDDDVEAITDTWVKILATQENNTYGSMLNTAQLAHLVQFYLTNAYSGVSPDSLSIEWMPNKSIITMARKQLRRPIDIDLLDTKLQQELQNKLGTMSVDEIVTNDKLPLFVDTYQLPRMYTKEAWTKLVAQHLQQIAMQASAGDWVLNQPIIINNDAQLKPVIDNTKPDMQVALKLKQTMLAHYFNNYLQAWYQWMQHLQLKPFTSLANASDALLNLDKNNGSIVKLLQTIATNLAIQAPGSHYTLFSKNHEAPIIYQALIGTGDVMNTRMMSTSSNSMKQYLQSLQKIQGDVENISVSSNQEQAASDYAEKILSSSPSNTNLFNARVLVGQLLDNVKDNATKKAITSILLMPLKTTWQALLSSAAKNIQTHWQNQVIPAYQSELSGKVPFVKNGPDISIEPMQIFFAPKTGIYWKFIDTQVVPYVRQDGVSWTINTWLGEGMPLSSGFMKNLDQAQQITSTLFSENNTSASFDYSLYPIPEPHVSQLGLTVNDQDFTYRNGPQQWHYYHWSKNQAPQQTKLTVIKNDGQARAQVYTGGMWSLFKLLSKASKLSRVGTYYLVQWKLSGSDGRDIDVALRFRTDGPADAVAAFVKHPFKPPYMITDDAGELYGE